MRISFRRSGAARLTAAAAVLTAATLTGVGATEAVAATPTRAPAQQSAKAPGYVTCTGSDIKITLSNVVKPNKRLLLTATNTGSQTCALYYYPFLDFGDAQAPVADVAASIPQAVVFLSPHQSGYAGVRTSTPGAVTATPRTPSGSFAARGRVRPGGPQTPRCPRPGSMWTAPPRSPTGSPTRSWR
ncbi:DUF4232 domain-containing protein [Streptacidiphilus sp. 4-A2]|nr:DUF4232 domain-containing protein [Streptacidiphilus sp. 4-A2]